MPSCRVRNSESSPPSPSSPITGRCRIPPGNPSPSSCPRSPTATSGGCCNSSTWAGSVSPLTLSGRHLPTSSLCSTSTRRFSPCRPLPRRARGSPIMVSKIVHLSVFSPLLQVGWLQAAVRRKCICIHVPTLTICSIMCMRKCISIASSDTLVWARARYFKIQWARVKLIHLHLNLIVHLRSKCGQGGKKSEIFADIVSGCSLIQPRCRR